MNTNRARGIILDDQGKILLVTEKDGFVGLPGGHIEDDETSEQAALREIKEELGLEFKAGEMVGHTSEPFSQDYFILGQMPDQALLLSDEIRGAGFVGRDELPSHLSWVPGKLNDFEFPLHTFNNELQNYITHEDSKWIVHAESGKHLGEYDTEAEAKRRLAQIEYFKHKGNDLENCKMYNSEITDQGGVLPQDAEELERAKAADLVTLPVDVEGTNCGNCRFLAKDGVSCNHPDVRQQVTARMCCKFWDAVGTARAWEGGQQEEEHLHNAIEMCICSHPSTQHTGHDAHCTKCRCQEFVKAGEPGNSKENTMENILSNSVESGLERGKARYGDLKNAGAVPSAIRDLFAKGFTIEQIADKVMQSDNVSRQDAEKIIGKALGSKNATSDVEEIKKDAESIEHEAAELEQEVELEPVHKGCGGHCVVLGQDPEKPRTEPSYTCDKCGATNIKKSEVEFVERQNKDYADGESAPEPGLERDLDESQSPELPDRGPGGRGQDVGPSGEEEMNLENAKFKVVKVPQGFEVVSSSGGRSGEIFESKREAESYAKDLNRENSQNEEHGSTFEDVSNRLNRGASRYGRRSNDDRLKEYQKKYIDAGKKRNPDTGQVEREMEPKTNVTPPGGEKVVKALKKEPGVDNPWAVAWSMKGKGQI